MEARDREEQAVDYFACPELAMMQVFLNYHPKQDAKNPVVKKVFTSKDGKSRKRLTYCHERHALFCFLCLAFSKPTDSNIFINGMSDWRHVHQRSEEHKKSMAHRNCAEAYFLNCSKADIKNLLEGRQLTRAQKSGQEEASGFGTGSGGRKSDRKEGPKLQTGGE